MMKKTEEGRNLLSELEEALGDDVLRLADEQIAKGAISVKNIKHNEIQQIDLDALKFMQGPRLMANKKCILPKGSTRLTKNGYEEVYVPAIRQTTGE